MKIWQIFVLYVMCALQNDLITCKDPAGDKVGYDSCLYLRVARESKHEMGCEGLSANIIQCMCWHWHPSAIICRAILKEEL